MNWTLNDGVLLCNTRLEDLELYGSFRYLSINEKVANAVIFDNVSKIYRLGYVIMSEDNNLNTSYSFKCSVKPKYINTRKNTRYFKEWCFKQKLS
jgi:hypothetical protein